MSNEAITWALAQPVKQSSAKFVLVVMANRADANLICWPSMADICAQTAQDRKTVQENIRRLREAGFIEDTGERKGSTKQVIVYRLKTPEIGPITTSDDYQCDQLSSADQWNKEDQKRNSSENGIGPNFPPKRPEIPYEEAQISHERGPKTGHGTHKEPSRKPKGNHKEEAQPFTRPDWIPEKAWNGYLDMRREKRKVPTARACELVVDELQKLRAAGHDVADVLNQSTRNGWTDVYAVKGQHPARASPNQPHSQERLNADNEQAKRLLFGKKPSEVIDV